MARKSNKRKCIEAILKELQTNPEHQKLTIAIAKEKINWQFDGTERTLYNDVVDIISKLYDLKQEFNDLPDDFIYEGLIHTLSQSGYQMKIDKLYNMTVL